MRGHEHYAELKGRLDRGAAPAVEPKDKVVFSDISHGGQVGTRARGMGLKYVARGREYYRIGDRTFSVGPGQFLCMRQDQHSEVEVRKTGESTLGLCIFLRENGPLAPDPSLDEPMLFSARCSTLGFLLESTMKRLVHPVADRPQSAAFLLGQMRGHLEPLLEETLRGIEALDAIKPATRYENLRRLGIARGYLHQVTDRPVELAELAAVAGMSKFQLLRYFRDCYGAPPAAYHRRLRLELARASIERSGISCGEAAQLYGFSGASSFSHAFRRWFGHSPTRAD